MFVKNPDGTYTVTLTATEARVVNAAEKQWGSNVLEQLLADWIAERKKVLAQINRKRFETQFEALSPTEQQQVQDILDGTP